MNIEQKRNGTALTIAPEGYLDTTTAPQLKAVLDTALAGVKEGLEQEIPLWMYGFLY